MGARLVDGFEATEEVAGVTREEGVLLDHFSLLEVLEEEEEEEEVSLFVCAAWIVVEVSPPPSNNAFNLPATAPFPLPERDSIALYTRGWQQPSFQTFSGD